MYRRIFTATAVALAALASINSQAADSVKLVVSVAPGGPADRIARIVLPGLSAALGKPVIVDNRGGAGGTLAANAVAKSPPDGDTLLITTFSFVLSAGTMPSLPYNPRKDFEPIYLLGEVQTMLVVRPSLGVNTLTELAARARDGKLNYGSTGVGGTMHLGAELFNKTANVSIAHIPYRGAAPALMDMLAGNVDIVNADVPLLQPYIKDGRVKGLAIFDTKRSPLVPTVPTAAEAGMPELQMTSWYGVLAPAGTPVATQQKLSRALDDVLRQPDVAKQLADLGFNNAQNSAGFKARLDKDFDHWIPWLKKANIKTE
ncbi:MAG: tripartite tricarboxylate transporter substrate-binding protein [Pseudomonadota bacterium]